MLLIIALVAALLWLDSPWSWVVIGLAAVWEVAQTALGFRWNRRRRARVGAHTLIGQTGMVVRECRPDGQIKVQGELWKAHCAIGVDAGAEVEVTGMEGLTLFVRPREGGSARS